MKCKIDECLIVQVAEKLSLIEQQKMEMERQQKVQYLPTFTPQINEGRYFELSCFLFIWSVGIFVYIMSLILTHRHCNKFCTVRELQQIIYVWF
jgi:hypothetical protein